jgi:hypothetical protein
MAKLGDEAPRGHAGKVTPEEIARARGIVERQKYLEEQAAGEVIESYVAEALKYLVQSGDIAGFHWCAKLGELDMIGIDFLVLAEYNLCLPLQVKSSEKGRLQHIEDYGKYIPCIVVRRYSTIEEIAEQIMSALALSNRSLEAYLEKVVADAHTELMSA